jgi:uncharacterized RDD family membrane protein YckC
VSDRDLTSGDPLRGPDGPEDERSAERASRPAEDRWQEVAPTGAYAEPGARSGGYLSGPPPGAGGLRPAGHATPAAGQLVLSGWWRRVGAAVIDAIIVGAVAVAIMAPLGIGIFASGGDETGVVAFGIAFFLAALVVTAVALLYAPILMARTNGQTVGRMATGIRVVRTNGQRMSFGWALLREVIIKGLLFNAIGGSVTFGLAGLLDVLWPLWDEENRALHDFVVQTRVVLA